MVKVVFLLEIRLEVRLVSVAERIDKDSSFGWEILCPFSLKSLSKS